MSAYDKFLSTLVDKIFDEATYNKDWTWNQLAGKANLCYTTVYNLGMRITQAPSLRTVFKLCNALDMDVNVVKKELKKAKRKAA